MTPDDTTWQTIIRYRRFLNGCTLSVGGQPGGWRWSVNRYPDVHETGEAPTMDDAMDAANNVARAEPLP